MKTFAQIASQIRHSSLLQNSDWLWNILRKPYHYLLDIKNKGVEVRINDSFSYRIPSQYYSVGLEDYERTNMECLISWIKDNPECQVLDIGCSLGFVSAISLFASEKANVIGFDSDVSSLKATVKMCQYASQGPIRVVFGLISEESSVKRKLEEAIVHTSKVLASSNATGDPGTTRYVNIDHADGNIPIYSLDDLLENENLNTTILLKCDIEGAELLALKGAKKFIEKNKPALLLSVHPNILPVFNGSVAEVKELLESLNYSINIISIDHEEHWWCQKNSSG